MSVIPDFLYHLGGVPVTSDLMMVPRYKSNIYWVDGLNGTTGNDGLAYDRPLSTIAAAITLMNARIDWAATPWAKGDVLVISPGVYAENITSLPYGCTIIGLGDAFDLDGQRGVTIKPASGSPVAVTSCINTRIHNICFHSPDASAAFHVHNLNRSIISNCLFNGLPGASPTSVYGLQTTLDMTGSRISDCVFQVFTNGIHITVDNGNSKQATGDIIERCYIRGCTTTGIYFDINSVPSMTVINDCIIGDGSTTLALGLDDNAGQVMVTNTMFECTALDPASTDADSSYNHCYLNGALIT